MEPNLIFFILIICLFILNLIYSLRKTETGMPRIKNPPKPPLKNHVIDHKKIAQDFSLQISELKLKCFFAVVESNKGNIRSLDHLIKESNQLFLSVFPNDNEKSS